MFSFSLMIDRIAAVESNFDEMLAISDSVIFWHKLYSFLRPLPDLFSTNPSFVIVGPWLPSACLNSIASCPIPTFRGGALPTSCNYKTQGSNHLGPEQMLA